MRHRSWIAFALACVTSTFAACLSFGDLSGGEDDGGASTDASLPDALVESASASDSALTADVDSDAGFIPTPDGSCAFATPFGTPTPLAANSTADDWGPRLSADGLTIYFASSRPGHGDGGAGIFSANRASAATDFAAPTLMANVNLPNTEIAPTVSGDGLELFFEENASANAGSIYFSTRANLGNNFGAPVVVPNINSGSEQHAPFVRADDGAIYFSRRSLPFVGKLQIARSIAVGGAFGAPAGEDELNSNSFDTTYAAVTPDDLTIFFASNNPKANAGGYDIWMAQRSSTADAFSSIVPLPNLSSAGEDYPAWVSSDRCTLYFFSSRGAGGSTTTKADLDMYVSTRAK